MPPSKQTIFLDGKAWEIFRERSWSPTEPNSYAFAHSVALICPRCLRQWAIMAFEEDEDTSPTPEYCLAHGGGSLFLRYGSLDLPLLRALPEELLKRELLLHINRLEKRDGSSAD